jgi:serine/threonine protein kinase
MASDGHDFIRASGYERGATLRHGAVYKARIHELQRDGKTLIAKDLGPMHPFFRVLFGRRVLRHEGNLLEHLAKSGVVPRLVERLGHDVIVLERIDAGHLRKKNKLEPPSRIDAVLQRLAQAVDTMHRHGVAHLDLRNRRNILVTADDRVVLLDFESGRRIDRGIFGRMLRPLLIEVDRQAVLEWRHRLAPASLSAAELESRRRYRSWKKFWFVKKLGKRVRRVFGIVRKPRIVSNPVADDRSRSS